MNKGTFLAHEIVEKRHKNTDNIYKNLICD